LAKKKLKANNVKVTTFKRMKKALTVSSNLEYAKAKEEFLSKFTLCEISCKSVIEHYKKIQNYNVDSKSIKLDMRTIPNAFDKFQYNIERHILTIIFSSENNRGKKSAKKLRDGIIHALSEDDIKEVIDRKEYSFKNMDLFLELIGENQVN
jgi:superfamily II DNA or RNA helicase